MTGSIDMKQTAGFIGRLTGGSPEKNLRPIVRTGLDLPFSEVFRSRMERGVGLTFSAHAQGRLDERGVALDGEDLSRLAGAVDRAAGKGGVNSLILMDDNAFIVSVPNRTVVTAMTGKTLQEHVFTNIDSTVIA